MLELNKQEWTPFLKRYVSGERRAAIFRDMVLADARKMAQDNLTFLDIGCGNGFDNDKGIQQYLAQVAGQYIGVEPDEEIKLGDFYSSIHRCYFENAPIESDSIDIAFAVMVLEHFENPRLFWDKLNEVLRPGGVFWGFTVDARHLFVLASMLSERLNVKDKYLDVMRGKRGEQRYENYKVFYRSNTPKQIQAKTKKFHSVSILNFARVGQMDYYIPAKLRWLSRTIERIIILSGLPGINLAVRVEK
jgi:SAM-dependent methyltransferase